MADLDTYLPEALVGSVKLRQPNADDVELILGYFDTLGDLSRRFFAPHPFDRENAEKICRDESECWYRVVAELDDRIVGYAWFAPFQEEPYPVVGIAISDDFHGRRLGGALMDVLTAEARARKLAGLRLTVFKDNDRGIRLYRSRGYVIVGDRNQHHVMDLNLTA